MSLEKLNSQNLSDTKNKISELSKTTSKEISGILSSQKEEIISRLKEIEKKEKWYFFQEQTINALFEKYPNLSISEFEQYFLIWTYNKNILMCSSEIIDILNLEEITPWSDLVEYIINKISISKEKFDEEIIWKMDILTFPNLAAWDVAQWYFFDKLKKLLPQTQIIFWDMPEIRKNLWKNQFNCDSVWFIDLMWNWLFNTCLLKLLKTPPVEEKINELNELFKTLQKDIFIWWSTFNIPFKIPESLYWISMPKTPSNWTNKLNLLKNWTLINSMWYLNSAYYATKVKASFVLWSHNIAEPMHAWKLTVINNDPKNRYNHNWLISYFWEKAWLLHYMEWTDEENQQKINEFLEIPKEELEKRYKKFQELYETQIKSLIYWIFYNFLRKNFPEYIK